MATTTPLEAVMQQAGELAGQGVSAQEATDGLLAAAGGNRRTIEAARDQVAARIRAHVDDFEATAALQLLNRVLATLPIDDPLDWRVRWTQRFRKP
jgi:hypothetical protein